jgi:hypothetical protein
MWKHEITIIQKSKRLTSKMLLQQILLKLRVGPVSHKIGVSRTMHLLCTTATQSQKSINPFYSSLSIFARVSKTELLHRVQHSTLSIAVSNSQSLDLRCLILSRHSKEVSPIMFLITTTILPTCKCPIGRSRIFVWI